VGKRGGLTPLPRGTSLRGEGAVRRARVMAVAGELIQQRVGERRRVGRS